MLSGLSFGGRPQKPTVEPLVLDPSPSSASSSRAHPAVGPTARTPGSTFRSVPAFAASSSTDGRPPKFNDPWNSDIKVEVVNSAKGEVHSVLHLHCDVLREQSDHFFNALSKKVPGTRDTAQLNGSPSTTFTIHTSKHVPDPEVYVTVLGLCYQEDDLISEDIVCMGSVWRVLQVLVVAAELQFHACVSACVDYLESVPWNDEELEDIVKLVPQLDRLHDAQAVLDRLPIRQRDEESIADALRMLLIRSVTFVDGLGGPPVTPGANSEGREENVGWKHTDSGAPKGRPSEETLGGDTKGAETTGEDTKGGETTAADINAGETSEVEAKDKEMAGGAKNGGESRDGGQAVDKGEGENGSKFGGAESRCRQLTDGGHAVGVPGTMECRDASCSILRNHQDPLLPLKTKKVLLRETFVDLLQCLWSEQRRHSGRRGWGGGDGGSGRGSMSEGQAEGTTSQDGEKGTVDEREVEGMTLKQVGECAPVEETTSVINGHELDAYEWTPLSPRRETPPLPPALLESIYGPQGALTWLTKVMIEFSMTDEVFKWFASDKGLITQAVKTYKQAMAADAEASKHQEASLSSMAIIHSCLLSLAGAILSKRVVVNNKIRTSFVRLWIPVLSDICVTSPTGQDLLYGVPLTKEEQGIVLLGYNELVLTLPAPDQHSVFQSWYGKLQQNSSKPQTSGCSQHGSRWFSLSTSYKRWLVRLGTPCGISGPEP